MIKDVTSIMNRLAVPILIIMAIVGCSPNERDIEIPYHVYLKSQDEDSVRDDLIADAKRWNDALGVEAFIVHPYEEPPADGCFVVIGFGGRLGTSTAQASCDLADPCRISINLSTNGYWSNTVAHELGHVLGLLDDKRCADSATHDDPMSVCYGIDNGPPVSIMSHGTTNTAIVAGDVERVLKLIM